MRGLRGKGWSTSTSIRASGSMRKTTRHGKPSAKQNPTSGSGRSLTVGKLRITMCSAMTAVIACSITVTTVTALASAARFGTTSLLAKSLNQGGTLMGILLSGVNMPKEHEYLLVRIYGDGYATVKDDGGEVVVATASEHAEEES